MSKKLDLSGMLDYTEMDMTPPNKVVDELLQQIPENTSNIIYGSIEEYSGPVMSYKTKQAFAEAFGTITTEKYVNIQDSLGKLGEEPKKHECYLYTSIYEDYKYRLFFMKYGTANYPVQFTLEESIAQSIYGANSNYIVSCNNREEVEELVLRILTSKKVVGIMQELIRIYQAKRIEASTGEGMADVVIPTDAE